MSLLALLLALQGGAPSLLLIDSVPTGADLFERAAPRERAEDGDEEGARVERHLGLMGTRLEIEIVAESRSEALAASEAALSVLRRVEARLSTWRDDSELARFNSSPVDTPFRPSPELARELQRAFAWRDATRGAFDPCVGALIDLWDLRGEGRRPSDAEIVEASRQIRPEALSLNLPHDLVRRHASLRIEEGGFGKGAGLELALRCLRAEGVLQARIDLGGQSALLCGRENQTIGVAHPDERDRDILLVELSGGSIATSGNSERGLRVKGEFIGHVLDPRSGRPADDFGSLSVWCSSAFDADCLSTACYVMGPDRALQFASRREGIEIIVLQRAGDGLRLRATRGLRGRLSPVDADRTIEWFPNLPSDSNPDNPAQHD